MISLHHRPLPLPPRFPKRLLRMRDVVHLGRSELHSPHGANKAPSLSQCGKRSESLHPALTVGAWEGSLKKNNTCWIINGARCDEARASRACSPPFCPFRGFSIWFYGLAGGVIAFGQCHRGRLLSASRRAHDGAGWVGGAGSGVDCWRDIPCPLTSSRRGRSISRHRWLFSSKTA